MRALTGPTIVELTSLEEVYLEGGELVRTVNSLHNRLGMSLKQAKEFCEAHPMFKPRRH